ncbi:hypothetical protein CPB84DRAFT_1726845 [Gymnopilus junonius]|uniref:Peptidase M3A/M3B catalytic domain-containing protein n=1 Tax=Gymnopilus junonius TaxID=109634 RepID=A0A9P5NR97_GYMJU|nr:hypothetical protein CPB84DRAFT_1726845 [Gymnopilus junonius]
MALIPPQPPLAWRHTAEDILKSTEQSIVKYKDVLDEVGALESQDCNFESVAIANAHTGFGEITEQLKFYKNVSPSKELRDAADKAESLLNDFEVERSIRLDVFAAKAFAEDNIKQSNHWDKLSPEERRLVEKMILDGKRNGLALSADERAELTVLKKELKQVCSEFRRNFNEENGSISFGEEELKGVPQDEIAGYTKSTDDDKETYTVALKGPDIGSILGYAENSQVRKKAYEAQGARLAVNVPLFSRAMELRRRIATVLRYNTWADYVTEIKMAKSGKVVEDFLNDLEEKLKPLGINEIKALLELKRKEHEERGLPFDGKFYEWDHGYYRRLLLKQTLGLDGLVIKQHFPVSVVVPAVLSIYKDLFSLRFEEVKDASTWHPEVQLFAVWEKGANDDSGFLGYFYLDLYPRPGKYSHNAVWPLLEGHELPDKKRAYPELAMVANLAKPTPEKPALMRHHDVWTFFHEMGHIFHSLLSKTQFARFHGLNVTRDFEEAPSQMLENWCWEPKVLEKLSSHYEMQKPLSPELIEKLINTRYMNTGLFYLHQVFLAKFDLRVHMDPIHDDYAQFWCSLHKEIHLHEYDKVVPGHAAFKHTMGGYDVGYYGYTWSQVFAEDMYVTVFKPDPLDPARGKRYRDIVLYPGGSKDEMEILQEFLGRPPNNEAFIRQILGTA